MVWISKLSISSGKGDIKCLGKVLTQIMEVPACNALPSCIRAHGIGCGSSGKFLLLTLLSYDHGDCHIFFSYLPIDV